MTPVNEAVPGKLYRLSLLNYEEDKRLLNLHGKVVLFVLYRKTPKYHPASGSRREYGIMKFLHGDHLESFKRDVSGISLEEFNDP